MDENDKEIFKFQCIKARSFIGESNESTSDVKIPKLMTLAASSIRKTTTKPPVLPQVQPVITHDYNAFICSLFNKIDLNKEKECIGPFSTRPAPSESIIAEAVEKHKPVGEEKLPDYKDTISSMVINEHKKIFKPEYDISTEHTVEAPVSLNVENLNNLCNVDFIRRAVYSSQTPKPNLSTARMCCAPYNAICRQHSHEGFKYIVKSISEDKNHRDIICHRNNSEGHPRVVDNNKLSPSQSSEAAAFSLPSYTASSSIVDDLSPGGVTEVTGSSSSIKSSVPDELQFGPLRIRRKRNSSTEEDNYLTKNELRLFMAVCTNNVGRAEVLLSGGSCPATCADSRGRTPLHIAAVHGYSQLVRVLLKHGADPNRLDSIGNRPLDLALTGKQIHVAIELILAGTAPTADREAAIATLSRLARDILAEVRAVDNIANVHTSRIYQAVRVLQRAMECYNFTVPEVPLILEQLQQYGLTDPNLTSSAVEELSDALSKSLYFDR